MSEQMQNNAREIYRETTQLTSEGLRHYECSVLVDEDGQIAMGAGGTCWSLTIREWLDRVAEHDRARAALRVIVDTLGPNDLCDCAAGDPECGLRHEAGEALKVAREALGL